MEKNPKIVIIGAGAAGIAAAVRLIQKEITDFIILEAEDRIGGRIHSEEFGDSIVDLGAQWCHGEEGNVVYEMVKDLDLLGTSFNTYTGNQFYQSGKEVDVELTDELYRIAVDIVEDEKAFKGVKQSLGEYFVERFRCRVRKEMKDKLKDNQCMAEDFISWFHSFILCYEAAPCWYTVSLTNSEYEKCPGDPLLQWKGKGFKTILDVLMKKYPEGSEEDLQLDDKILLKKEVCCIHWNVSGDDYEAEIHCTDESVYKTSQVLITVSLGALKRYHKSLFDPELPERKQVAINSLGFGGVTKIFLKFPEKWWPEDSKGFSFLWNCDLRDKVRRSYPNFIKEDGKTWLEGIFGFYVIEENPTVLMGWLTGRRAADIESLASKAVMDACLFLLELFIGCLCSIPYPEKVLFSKWHTNRNFLGTWSFRSMETQQRQMSAMDLAEPVRKNRKNVLFFAGEATHPYYFSTVHGAIESGYREADRLAAGPMCKL